MPSSAPAFSLQFFFFFFFFFFYHFFSLLPAMAAMAGLAADPSPLLLLPPISTSPPSVPVPIPTTIPAFPEQSAISSACPLSPPDRLLPAVSASCSSAGSTSSSHCCPVLAAWLYAAYAPTALSLAPPLPAAAAAAGGGGGGGGGPGDLPLLPDDSESCAAAAARALRSRGGGLASSLLPRIDSCNVRLRRPSCPRPSASSSSSSASAQWSPPSAAAARRLLSSCSAPGLASCSRCLRALNQLKAEATAAVGGNATAMVKRKAVGGARGRDCQIMGLTWLLAKNGTRYLPAAASVLRTFMAADEAAASAGGGGGKEVDPTTCSVPDDDDNMPLAVDSAQINGHDKSFTVLLFSTSSLSIVTFLVLGLGLTLF